MEFQAKELYDALLKTANKLERDVANYQWGHMGACNCGNLAQELTGLSKGEIHERAMESHGDWNDQVREYCNGSQLPLDEVIAIMLQKGLSTSDLMHLETLSNPDILALLPKNQRDLNKNSKEDTVTYFRIWAQYLELKWIKPEKQLQQILERNAVTHH